MKELLRRWKWYWGLKVQPACGYFVLKTPLFMIEIADKTGHWNRRSLWSGVTMCWIPAHWNVMRIAPGSWAYRYMAEWVMWERFIVDNRRLTREDLACL